MSRVISVLGFLVMVQAAVGQPQIVSYYLDLGSNDNAY